MVGFSTSLMAPLERSVATSFSSIYLWCLLGGVEWSPSTSVLLLECLFLMTNQLLPKVSWAPTLRVG